MSLCVAPLTLSLSPAKLVERGLGYNFDRGTLFTEKIRRQSGSLIQQMEFNTPVATVTRRR